MNNRKIVIVNNDYALSNNRKTARENPTEIIIGNNVRLDYTALF